MSRRKFSPGSLLLVRLGQFSGLLSMILLATGLFLDPGGIPPAVPLFKGVFGKPDEEGMRSLAQFLRPFKPKAALELSVRGEEDGTSLILDRLESDLRSVSLYAGQQKY